MLWKASDKFTCSLRFGDNSVRFKPLSRFLSGIPNQDIYCGWSVEIVELNARLGPLSQRCLHVVVLSCEMYIGESDEKYRSLLLQVNDFVYAATMAGAQLRSSKSFRNENRLENFRKIGVWPRGICKYIKLSEMWEQHGFPQKHAQGIEERTSSVRMQADESLVWENQIINKQYPREWKITSTDPRIQGIGFQSCEFWDIITTGIEYH